MTPRVTNTAEAELDRRLLSPRRMSCRALPRTIGIFAFALLSTAVAAQAAVTRVEQNDKNVVYSGNWYSNENGANSGGSAALTNTRGARVSITFTGTGIAWIGVTDAWAGLATVYLDGSMKIVNTYGNGGYQQALFRASGLSSGPHTLSIEVTHERGPGTDGSWVWIDAFDIENGAPVPGNLTASAGRVEENNPALVYMGRWYANANPAHSGGNASLAMDGASKVTINFNGTGINWIAYRDEWSGIARVYLDGVEKSTIDNYLSPAGQRVVYSIGGLPSGSHSLTVEVTGSHNQSSKGSWVWLDAFDVTQ
jgi:hypothetical protein